MSDNLALKMATLYLAAQDYLVEIGVPTQLMEIAYELFGRIKGKPLTPKLLESVLFAAAPWHMRAARVFRLFEEEFKNNRNVVSYGSGAGLMEILALVASGNHTVKLSLIDNDAFGIGLARRLVESLNEHGYDIRSQVTTLVADIHKCDLPEGTDTVASIGLLHNYFPMNTANELMSKWFAAGAVKVLTDIYYYPESAENGDNDAIARAKFVKNVLSWKFGPPNGLLFCDANTFFDALPGHKVELYDHSLNATCVVHKKLC